MERELIILMDEQNLDLKPFRMPVQSVYKFINGGGDNRGIVVGTIESGSISIGDKIVFYPSGKVSKVKNIEGFNTKQKTTISGGGFICESIKDSQTLIREKAKKNNLAWQSGYIHRNQREILLNQKGLVLWFFGLSGAGKSSIAIELEEELYRHGKLVYRLDGDNIRHGLNSDLGFTEKDRIENIRRVAETAKLFIDAGAITLVSFITPFEEIRKNIQTVIGKKDVKMIYVKASVAECSKRDTKGLYKKAFAGEIENFTGVSAPFEELISPDLIIDTEKLSLNESVVKILDFMEDSTAKNETLEALHAMSDI